MNGDLSNTPAYTLHPPEADTLLSSDAWRRKLLWIFIGWLVFACGSELTSMARAILNPEPGNMGRAGMWRATQQPAQMHIDQGASRPVVLFLGDEGYLIKDVDHGRDRWHGTVVSYSTGARSGHATIDTYQNRLVVRYDDLGGKHTEITFDRCR